jgi:hypothetical protein
VELEGSDGDIGVDRGEGAMRLAASGAPFVEALEGDVAEPRRGFCSCRDYFMCQRATITPCEISILTDGLLETPEDELSTLPCLSCLWLEVGWLTWRPELDGLSSSVCRFAGAATGVAEIVAVGSASEDMLASIPFKLRLLYRFAGSKEFCRGSCMSSALLARLCPGRLGAPTSIAFNDGVLLCAVVPAVVDVPMEGDC